MSKPRIGLAMDVEDGSGPRATKEKSPFVFLKSAYVERVIEAGGIPFLLPPTHDESIVDAYLDSIDGLIVTGSGIDVPGEMYGHERHPKTGRLLPAKSEFEVRLIQRACSRTLPYLGICNGMQVMNVAYGGTLYQDLPSEKGVKHETDDATQPCHGVTLEAGTKLHLLIGAKTRRRELVASPGRARCWKRARGRRDLRGRRHRRGDRGSLAAVCDRRAVASRADSDARRQPHALRGARAGRRREAARESDVARSP